MNRSIYLAGAAVAAALGAVSVHAAGIQPGVKSQVIHRLIKAGTGPATAARARSRGVTYTLPIDSLVLADNDADGELSRGDIVTVTGPMADKAGNVVGTWEGTLTDSSIDNLYMNLTFLFAGKGTATVVGAQYQDGSGRQVPIAPIAGVTGKLRFRHGASFGVDEKDNFTITLFP